MKTTQELQQYVKNYKSGRQESFTIIYEQSYKYLHTCVMHVVKNEEAAMDMLQETYLEISRNLWQLKSEENFMSWAAMIANRKCFAYLRKQKDVLVSVDEDGENSDYFESIADNEELIPEAVLQDREKVRLIREIIDGLSDIQRLCVIGFYYNEQKQDEIAGELGIPVNTVKSHLNRAKAKIKEAVVDLDTKKGTRLYSFAPFMLLFLDLEAQACETATMSPVLESLCGKKDVEKIASVNSDSENIIRNHSSFENVNSKTTVSGTEKIYGAITGTEKAAKTAALSIKAKIVVAVVAGVVGIGCVGGAIVGATKIAEIVKEAKEEAWEEVEEDDEEVFRLQEQEEEILSEESETEEKVLEITQQSEEEANTEEVSGVGDEEIPHDEDVTQEMNEDVLPISGIYSDYRKGNQGLIPVRNEEGKYGLVTYDNQVIVPFEYDYACPMVNEDGHSFFRNDSGSYVFDKNGKQLFHTNRSIQSINEGIIFAMDGSYFEADFAYYNVNGEALYEYDVALGEDAGAAGYSEGYAFFSNGDTKRLTESGTMESLTDIKYANQSMPEADGRDYGMSEGITYVLHVPVSPLNKGFYLSRRMVVMTESYGVYTLSNADDSQSYCFDFSSLFNRKGLSFSRTEADWGFDNYFDNGCFYSNYGSLICPYTIIDGQKTSYLIDASKVVENKEGLKATGGYLSDEDIWDYDVSLLTKEAVLLEADDINISNEKYWLIEKDGKWGYIDHAGKIMEMYEDATEFFDGKALIIEGGKAYVINEAFEKIEEIGQAASVVNHGEVFKISMEDGAKEKMIMFH